MSEIRETGIGYTYHVSTRCVDQTYLLHKDEFKEIAIKVIEKAKERYDFNCFCFTILDNQVHMILQTPDENNISIIMQVINKNIATKCNKALNRTGHFWGARFCSTLIKSEDQLITTLVFLSLNPVKAGLVNDPKDWAWSSYNTYANNHKKDNKDNITDLHPVFAGKKNLREAQEYYKKLVSERRQEIILDFLYKQGYIEKDTVITSKEQVLELLDLYQKIQSQRWNDTISKHRTPEEFL
jgi:putative transposase